jgi:hypothetical protein
MGTTVKNRITVKRGESFRATHSQPEDWAYTGLCHYQHGHCDLCNTELMWKYSLRNVNTGQILQVGCECIKWYYEAYMPNGLELAIEMMKSAHKAEHARVTAEKIEVFRSEGFGWAIDYLLGRRSYRDGYLRCGPEEERKSIPASKFRASLKSKGYLSEEQIEKLQSGYDRAWWGGKYDQRQLEKEGEKTCHTV